MARSRRLATDVDINWIYREYFDTYSGTGTLTSADGVDHSTPDGTSYSDYIVVAPSSADSSAALNPAFFTTTDFSEDSFVVWGAGLISFGPVTQQQIDFMTAAVAGATSGADFTGFPGPHISLGFLASPATIFIGVRDPAKGNPANAFTEVTFDNTILYIYADHVTAYGLGSGAHISLGPTNPQAFGGTFDLRTLITLPGATSGDDVLQGGPGAETIDAGAGNDTILQGNGPAIIKGGDGNDTITITHPNRGATSVDGGTGINHLIIDTGGRSEHLTVLGDASSGGSAPSLGLTWSNIQQLDIVGGRDGDFIVGNSSDNTIDGGLGPDKLFGGAGNDTLRDGGLGAGTQAPLTAVSTDKNAPVNIDGRFLDQSSGLGDEVDAICAGYYINNGGAFYSFTTTETSTLTVSAELDPSIFSTAVQHITITLFDSAGNQIASFVPYDSVPNLLPGTYTVQVSGFVSYVDFNIGIYVSSPTPHPRVDVLDGGTGNDTFYVTDPSTVVIERPGEGNDTVIASVSYSLAGTDVENIQLTGSDPLNGTGNALNNTLTGNSAANVLTGGLGDDTYVVDNVGDKVIELSGQGYDTIKSSVSYALSGPMYPSGTFVEALVLTGTAAINATGNGLANALTGNSAANVLDGGAGADTMAGGLGDDTYIVDNVGDRANELSGQGYDTVKSSVTYSLSGALYPSGTFIEALVLTGSAAINGTGNGLDNAITGNSAANVLDGGAGADTMAGGLGDDTYIVDNANDRAIELSGQGYDTVKSSVTYSLSGALYPSGTFIEALVLTGSAAINGTGNGLDNAITGNSAANVLDGGAGADTMAGGLGDDTYIVDNANDRANELSGQGYDTVKSSVSYALSGANYPSGTFIEALILTGNAAINASGNGLANRITGNGAANVIDGGAGNDTLTGRAGADTFRFSVAPGAANADTITDFAPGTDRISLAATMFPGLAKGALDPAMFHAGTVAEAASDHIIYDSATGRLWFDSDGLGGADQALIATLAPGTLLSASDLIVA